MSEPIIAELWTIKLVCQKGCPVPDDACDNAGHPYGYRITYHADEWAKVIKRERIAIEHRMPPGDEWGLVRIPNLSCKCDGPVVDEDGVRLIFNQSAPQYPSLRDGVYTGGRYCELSDLIRHARRLIESCPHLRFEEMP